MQRPSGSWCITPTTASQSHEVRIEVWRSWGQKPLRAVAIDAQTSTRFCARWPFVALFVSGAGIIILILRDKPFVAGRFAGAVAVGNLLAWLTQPMGDVRPRWAIALLGVLTSRSGNFAARLVAGAAWVDPARLCLSAPTNSVGSYLALRTPLLLQPNVAHLAQSRHQFD